MVGECSLYFVFLYYDDLVVGVVSYWLEFLEVMFLDVVCVFIGMGFGICVVVWVCDVLGLLICIVGVVLVYV